MHWYTKMSLIAIIHHSHNFNPVLNIITQCETKAIQFKIGINKYPYSSFLFISKTFYCPEIKCIVVYQYFFLVLGKINNLMATQKHDSRSNKLGEPF